MRKVLLLCALIIVLVGVAGCGVPGGALEPGEDNYYPALISVRLMLCGPRW